MLDLGVDVLFILWCVGFCAHDYKYWQESENIKHAKIFRILFYMQAIMGVVWILTFMIDVVKYGL